MMITTDSEQIYFVRNLNESLMVYRVNQAQLIPYQIAMLRNNKIEHLLAIHCEEQDAGITLCYDISGRISLKEYAKQYYLTYDKLRVLFQSIIRVLSDCKEYLLDDHGILLTLDNIWVEPISEQFNFAYIPTKEKRDCSIKQFKVFVECITRYIHRQDERAIALIHRVNILLADENFGKMSMESIFEVKHDQINESVGVGWEQGYYAEDKTINNNPYQITRGENEEIMSRDGKNDARITFVSVQVLMIVTGILCGFKLHSVEINADRFDFGIKLIAGVFCICEILFLTKVVGITTILKEKKWKRRNEKTENTIMSEEKIINEKKPQEKMAQEKKPNEKISRLKMSLKKMQQEKISKPKMSKTKAVVKEPSKWGLDPRRTKRPHLLSANGVKIPIYRNSFLIGKMKESVDLFIDHEEVSRLHCKIYFENNNYYLVDLSSKNGTFLNNKRLKHQENNLLSENACIQIAKESYTFQFV